MRSIKKVQDVGMSRNQQTLKFKLIQKTLKILVLNFHIKKDLYYV